MIRLKKRHTRLMFLIVNQKVQVDYFSPFCVNKLNPVSKSQAFTPDFEVKSGLNKNILASGIVVLSLFYIPQLSTSLFPPPHSISG